VKALRDGATTLPSKQYTGRGVDLAFLSQWVQRFFKKKEFRVSEEVENGTFRIVARPTYVHEIVDTITVSVSGSSDDFKVGFFIGARSEALMKIGQLASLFGLGVLFLRGIRSEDAGVRLERDFWVFIEEKIDRIGSAARAALGSAVPS
jgi:hypothetical protein